jgi:hypothetical protein
MKALISTILVLITLLSCHVTEKNIVGTYRLRGPSRTMLVVKDDRTFEFVKNFAEPGPVFFPDSTEMNYRTAGNWQLNNGQLILNSFPNGARIFTELASDSITRNTDITSFSFWDQYGDPVPIRMIHFPANRTKLHKSNVISFFAEDFISADTLEFHFYGYLPYRWITKPDAPAVNNQHRITLYEPYRKGFFNNVVLNAGKNKLTSPDNSFSMFKGD